jgi:hypothetical protein
MRSWSSVKLPNVQPVTWETTSLVQITLPVCAFSAYRRPLPKPPSVATLGSGAPKITASSPWIRALEALD